MAEGDKQDSEVCTLSLHTSSPIAHGLQEVEIKGEKSIESFPDPLAKTVEKDQHVVRFALNDPADPLNWPLRTKWSIVALVSAMTLLDMYATTTIVPAVPQILADFGVAEDDLYYTLLVSIWELGEGLGPFLVAPLSELYGRLPIYHVGNILFLLCLTASALSTNISMLVAFRFMNGFVITSLTLGPSIVADLFKAEERGRAMALALVLPLMGPVVAPIVGGFSAQAKGWRWAMWVNVIAVGAVTGLSLAFFRETYGPRILRRRNKPSRAFPESSFLWPLHHGNDESGVWSQSMGRPVKMLFLSPVVLIISAYTAVTYGFSYLLMTKLSKVMEDTYKFEQGVLGLAFLGIALGNLIGLMLYGLTSDRYIKHRQVIEGVTKPEHRLPIMLAGAAIFPIGFFLYGWTADRNVQWIVPIIGSALTGISAALTIVPAENYLVDSYDLYGASAIAANVILRALCGAVIPLAGPSLYNSLGLGWGNSVLAFITIALIPLVLIMMTYGERIRNSSWSDRGRHLWATK